MLVGVVDRGVFDMMLYVGVDGLEIVIMVCVVVVVRFGMDCVVGDVLGVILCLCGEL